MFNPYRAGWRPWLWFYDSNDLVVPHFKSGKISYLVSSVARQPQAMELSSLLCGREKIRMYASYKEEDLKEKEGTEVLFF